MNGFDKSMIIGNFELIYGLFWCGMCNRVAKDIKQCNGCQFMYCKPCISSLKPYLCPNECANSQIVPIKAHLQNIYDKIIINCNICGKNLMM